MKQIKSVNESVNSDIVNDLISKYKQYNLDYLHAIGFWVNEQGESVYSMGFLPAGKSSLTGLDKLTNDDIITSVTYKGDYNLSKVNLRLKDGGDPMIKKTFEKLGKDIINARFLLDIYIDTKNGKLNYIIVLNKTGLEKYMKVIKDKKADIDKGHSREGSTPLTNLQKYKIDKSIHTDGVKEWLYPLKDKIDHTYVFWVGKDKNGKPATLMNIDPIKSDKFDGFQYLTDLDIIAKDIVNRENTFTFEHVDLLKGGNEKHINRLFNSTSESQLNKARVLIVLETNKRTIVSFLLNEAGFKKYLRALKRKGY